ncbi:hypothetical protein HKBW3S03_02209, partial [Candidatus Hakubella thermalkaliphila]
LRDFWVTTLNSEVLGNITKEIAPGKNRTILPRVAAAA